MSPVFVTDPQVDNLAIVRVGAQTEFALQFLGAPPLGYSLFTIVTLKLHWSSVVTVRRSDLVASLIPRLGRLLGPKSHQDDRDGIEFLNNGFVNALGIISPVGQNVLGSEVPEILSRIFQKWDALWPVMPFRCRNFEPHGDVCICIGDQMAFVSKPPIRMSVSSSLSRPRSIGVALPLSGPITVGVHDSAINCDSIPEARDYFIEVGNQSGHAFRYQVAVGQEFLPKSAVRPRRGDFIGMENAAQVGKQRVISQSSNKSGIRRDVLNETCKYSPDHDRDGIAGPARSADSLEIFNQANDLGIIENDAQAFGKIAVLPFAKRSTIDTLCYDTTSQGFIPLDREAPFALESWRGLLDSKFGQAERQGVEPYTGIIRVPAPKAGRVSLYPAAALRVDDSAGPDCLNRDKGLRLFHSCSLLTGSYSPVRTRRHLPDQVKMLPTLVARFFGVPLIPSLRSSSTMAFVVMVESSSERRIFAISSTIRFRADPALAEGRGGMPEIFGYAAPRVQLASGANVETNLSRSSMVRMSSVRSLISLAFASLALARTTSFGALSAISFITSLILSICLLFILSPFGSIHCRDSIHWY